MKKLKEVVSSMTVKSILLAFVGILYFPVFSISVLLRLIARVLLAISYYGILKPNMGYNIFSTLFDDFE